MNRYIGREILRRGVTQLATNYIVLDRLLKRKVGMHRCLLVPNGKRANIRRLALRVIWKTW